MAAVTLPYGIGRGYDRGRNLTPWFVRVRGKKVAYFRSEAERDADFNQRIAEARAFGDAGMADMTAADRAAMHEMKREADAAGMTPLEVFRLGLTLTSRQGRTATLGDAGRAFSAYVDQRLARGRIRGRRATEAKRMVSRFCGVRQQIRVHQVTREDIRLHLKRLDVGAQTEMNNARTLSQFFDWCIGEGWCRENPVVIDYRIDRSPETMGNREVAELFAKAKEMHPALLPMLIVQWFAGVRPTATHAMEWSDIDFKKRHIILQAKSNKTRQPDVIEGLPDAFWEKLSAFRGSSGPVRAPGHIKRMQAVHNALGYGLPPLQRWPTDVARHTFASNLYALTGDISEVSRVLRHTGSRVTLKHYVAKGVRSEDALAYFALKVC